MQSIPFQLKLVYPNPVVVGNHEYLKFQKILEKVDKMLVEGNLEEMASSAMIQRSQLESGSKPLSLMRKMQIRDIASKALRCSILLMLTRGGFRRVSFQLADSSLMQRFCGLISLDQVSVPSKSTLESYSKMFSETELRGLVMELIRDASSAESATFDDPIEVSDLFYDSTCVSLNIHYPVDWVLLRDATRTLMKAVELIRKQGLINRMNAPKSFMKAMNRLCIEMTHSRRKLKANKQRKLVLRKMKKLSKIVASHAKKHKELLVNRMEETNLSKAQAENIINRIDGVLSVLPDAIKQAHERIIGERIVKSCDKILSIYESDPHVIVRGKTGAEVEFGNTLLIAEQRDGVIVDWSLLKERSPGDGALLIGSLDRISEALKGRPPGSVTGDRGFDGPKTRACLEKAGIVNGVCQKSVPALREQMENPNFAALQTRRGQTEARIAILKNGFIGSPIKSKGYKNQNIKVAFAVLTHNLWVLARMLVARDQEKEIKMAA